MNAIVPHANPFVVPGEDACSERLCRVFLWGARPRNALLILATGVASVYFGNRYDVEVLPSIGGALLGVGVVATVGSFLLCCLRRLENQIAPEPAPIPVDHLAVEPATAQPV
jgi:hypothetical protein